MRKLHTPWAIFALLLPLTGCGMGTEIGNGNRPPKDDDHAAKAASESDKDPVDEINNQGKAADSTDVPVDGDASMEPGNNQQPFEFDIDLLFAPCGSPLGEDLLSPITLRPFGASAGANNVLVATLVGLTWEVSNFEGSLLRHVTPVAGSVTAEVTTTDAEDRSVAAYTCAAAPVRTANATDDGLPGTYERTQVTVLKGNLANVVTWYLEGTAPHRLVRISVDDVDGEDDPMVLDAE